MSKLLSKTVHNTEYHLIQNLKYYDSRDPKMAKKFFSTEGKEASKIDF